MMKICFLVVLLTYSISLNSAWQEDCSVCKLDEYFNQSNGYGCIRISNNETICTCPDQQSSAINQPCRICNRKEICGSKSIFCSEKSSSLKPTDGGPYFACFCSSSVFLINQKCPEEMSSSTLLTEETTILTKETTNESVTTIVVINDTTAVPIITTITPFVDNITTQKVITCDSSHLYIEKILIILLNLVYFFNK